MKNLFLLAPFALITQSATLPGLQVRTEGHTLTACLDKASVSYVDAQSSNWTDAIAPQNLRVHYTPKALVYATKTKHVQDAVLCGVRHHVKVTAKSGGHSYASYGLGGEDGHLIIQLDHMYGATVRSDNTALVKAGSRLGHTALELFNQAKRGFSHGTCPSVGVGGHVVHGGFGFSSHTHGLSLDAIVGANIVLANGTLVHASKTENPDLFWAIRGAGSSFGIVVEFEFETFAVPEQLTVIDVATKVINGTKEQAVAGFLAWQELLTTKGVDRKLNMRINVISQTLEVVYHGTKEDALEALKPLEQPLSLDWNASVSFIRQGDWIDAFRARAGTDPLDLTTNYTGHSDAYKSNLVTKALPKKALEAFFGYMYDVARAPGQVPWWLLIDVHGDTQSAIAAVPEDATSYVHRDKLWIFQVAGTITPDVDVKQSIKFVTNWMDSIKDNMARSDWGRYANYVDSELSRDDAQVQYWGQHLPRLQAIKADLDPEDLFRNAQSIEPAK